MNNTPSQISVASALTALLFAATARDVPAQYLGGGTKSPAETQLADLEQLKDKFVTLAEAVPDSTLDWRPMEGVRSFRQVFVLIAFEGTLFPTMWGFDAPAWTAPGGLQDEQRRLGELPRDDLIAELRRSFDNALEIMRGLTDEDRRKPVSFFGLDVDLSTALTLMGNDMHEHLGQAIAYARMNRIVPPWSRN